MFSPLQDLKDAAARLNHAIAQLEPTQASTLSGGDADTAAALAQVRIRELEAQVVQYRGECGKLLMAKSSLDREVGALIGERDELQRQLLVVTQEREDARAALSDLYNDYFLCGGIGPAMARAWDVLKRVSSNDHTPARAPTEETQDYKCQWEDTYNKLIAMERTARSIADERAHVATELLSLQRLGVALVRSAAVQPWNSDVVLVSRAALRALEKALGEKL